LHTASAPLQNAHIGIKQKQSWWRGLRLKIVAWSFVPTVIILSAVAWFTFYSYQRVVGDLAIKQDWAVLQSKTQPVYNAIVDLTNPVVIPIILSIDIKPERPIADRAQNIIDKAKNLDVFDGGVYFLDQQGKIYRSWPNEPELLGQDWSGTPQYLFMQSHPGKGAEHDLIDVGTTGKKILCTSISMNGPQGEFVGAVSYCFTIYPVTQNAYYKALQRLNISPNITLVDGKSRVMYSFDLSQIGEVFSGAASLQQLQQTQTMSGRFQTGKEDVLVTYTPVYAFTSNYVTWNLVKVESWSDVMQLTLPYRQLLLVLLALGVLVPVVVTAYGVRHITEPIQKLIRASEQVTAGQFKHRIEVKTGDEIETLANQFNVMSAELDDSYASLEKKVAERTQELATLNAIAARVSSSLNLNEIMADALERIMELTGMEHGIAYRIVRGAGSAVNTGADAEEAHLRVMAFRGLPPTFADLGDKLPLGQSAAGVAGRRGEPVIWTLAELPTDSALKARLVTLGAEQVVAIPLMAKGHLVGSLNLSTNQSRTYPPEQIALLKTIGQQIGVAIENAHLYAQAEETATTAERQRLARELHDAVTQTLFSANLIADVLPRIWQRNPDEGLQNLEELRQLTRGALAEMRTLLLEMRPESLERVDIKALLTQLAEAFIGRVRVPVSLAIQGECEITQPVKLVFYRVAQEALNNIAKHSGARQVELRLDCQAGGLNLLVRDDGLGFDLGALPPGHLGLAIMRERANAIGASLRLESRVGQGTTVELDWRAARKD
jgi:nitrate/nitrite-specific signal transduction histidine kinase